MWHTTVCGCGRVLSLRSEDQQREDKTNKRKEQSGKETQMTRMDSEEDNLAHLRLIFSGAASWNNST
jgi:hypothetical protein